MRPAGLAPLLLLAASGAACVYSPKGSCDTAADCAADERCSSGVCVPLALGRDGADPALLPDVSWATLAGAAGTAFSVDAVGADLAGGVVVAGAVSAPFDFGPALVPAGGFALKLDPLGAAIWATSFPTFAHGRFETAVLPNGDVFFAGTAFEPTTIVTVHTPPLRGTLFLGALSADTGQPLWRRAVDGTHATADLLPVAVAVAGGDLVVAGRGSGDLGCGDTGEASFAAVLGPGGACRWSRGLRTRTLSDVEARQDGDVAVAGVCTPSGAFFDPSPTTTCTKGLFLAVLDGDTGSSVWARTTSGAGTVTAVRDLAIAPDGRAAVVGDASGVVDLGAGPIDFGAGAASFAATFGPAGAPLAVVRPSEAPDAPQPDAMAFSCGAYDRTGRLWVSGTYAGQPTLGGVRFTSCRAPACRAASFLARLESAGEVSSFLSLRATAAWDQPAYIDDLVLFATTGTVAHALRFQGEAAVAGASWTSAGAGLGVLRVVP